GCGIPVYYADFDTASARICELDGDTTPSGTSSLRHGSRCHGLASSAAETSTRYRDGRVISGPSLVRCARQRGNICYLGTGCLRAWSGNLTKELSIQSLVTRSYQAGGLNADGCVAGTAYPSLAHCRQPIRHHPCLALTGARRSHQDSSDFPFKD